MSRSPLSCVTDPWNRFFFAPESPAALGLTRIALALVALLSVLGKYPSRDIFYGSPGIVAYSTVTRWLKIPDMPWLYFRWLPGHDPWLALTFVILMLALLSLAAGYRSRFVSVLAWTGMMLLSNRNPFCDNGGDELLRINLFWLMFTPSGTAYSVDKWIRVRRGLEGPALIPQIPWGWRVMMLQLSFLYIQTTWLKLQGGAWRDGTAIYYALNYPELHRFGLGPFASRLWQIHMATWGTLLVEGAAGTLIWLRRTRYWVMAAAFALHEGINLSLQFPIFQYVMMASLLIFLFPEDVERLMPIVLEKLRPLLPAEPLAPKSAPAARSGPS